MAENSYLWTTGGAGDGAVTYSRADWSRIARILAACAGPEGVAPGLLNDLSGSVTGANTVQINTGGAVVDGKPYYNDAAVNVNIPSAVGAGNTRIDRIVLRASWTAQTVRITRIAGTDAASPSAPVMTQNSGVTYDVPLYRATVNTSGTVTLVDERLIANVGTGEIADGAVTLAKIANDAVDDTKVGNRVPQFYRRQGGSASDWSANGTGNQTPGAVRMQGGVLRVPLVNVNNNIGTITFPVAFSNAPLVFLSTGGTTWSAARIFSVSASTLEVLVWRTDGLSTGNFYADVHWLAIGPE